MSNCIRPPCGQKGPPGTLPCGKARGHSEPCGFYPSSSPPVRPETELCERCKTNAAGLTGICTPCLRDAVDAPEPPPDENPGYREYMAALSASPVPRCTCGMEWNPGCIVHENHPPSDPPSVLPGGGEAYSTRKHDSDAHALCRLADEEYKRLLHENDDLRSRLAAVEQELATARTALERYGHHESECDVWGDYDPNPPCTCGFNTARNALASLSAGAPGERT